MSSRLALASLFLILPLITAAANAQRIDDNSDWWSLLKEDNGPEIKPKHEALNANFGIAGVSLGEKQFEQLSARLGKAAEVERGDASTGRHQVCYQSMASTENVHLVFEFGEVEENFYLFADGQKWTGSDLCAKSKSISAQLMTGSGLRLGLSRSTVIAVLGPPDFASGDRVVYSREVKRKTTQKEFEQMRKDYPQRLSDEEAHREFDYFDVGMYIEARFVKDKLNYLAVSRTETD